MCALLLAAVTAAVAPAPPRLLAPSNGQVLYCASDGATPTFTWDAGSVPRAVDGLPDTAIELSTSSDFSAAVFRDDVPAILERYVRAEPLGLAPVTYYWRVGRPTTVRAATAGGSAPSIVWSQVRSFQLQVPTRQITVPASVSGWRAVQELLASAAAASSAERPSLLRFEGWGSRTLVPPPRLASRADGRYRGSDPPAFIRLSSVTDLIIDGGGATITFSDYVQYVDLLNCSRVQIVNFVFDLKPLPYTALTIVSVDAEASAATMQLQPRHPTVEALLSSDQLETSGIAEVMSMAAASQQQQVVGSPLAPRTMRGVPEEIYFSNVTRVQPAALAGKRRAADGLRYRMVLKWAGTNPRLPQLHGVDRLARGDVIVIDPRIDIGFDVMGGDHVTLRNIYVFACANECFNSEHAESLAILQCGTRLQPGRFLAANNGGHNHHGSAVGQWVEGGVWENAGDDTIHVSGLVMSVLAIGGSTGPPYNLTLAPSYPDSYSIREPLFHHSLGVRQGDILQFYDFVTGVLLAARVVLAMREASAENPTVGVTLNRPLPATVTPGQIGGGALNQSVTQVFNFNRTSNQFVFRRNTVRNGRRVGVLYKGYRSWVDSNLFVGLGGGAMELWNAPYEGLFAQSVLFRNNTVRDVCQLSRAAAPIWTSVPRPDQSSSPALVHSDVRIENNSFDTGPGPIFWLGDISDVVVTANSITYCSKAVVYPSGGVLNTSNAHGVVLRDNTLFPCDSPRLCVK